MKTTTQGHPLTAKAMLVRLAISQWQAKREDKEITAKVAHENGCTPDVGRYTKNLIDKSALKPIQQLANEARTYHYTHSLPWTDTGYRILPASMFDEYAARMRGYKNLFENAVQAFLFDYDRLKMVARNALNGLYKEADYPTEPRLKKLYSMDFEVSPIPDAEDFRVSLNETEVNLIRQQLEARLDQAQADAMKDIWQRIYDALQHMVERLKDPDAIFRDTITGNLQELCDILPALNIAEDPALDLCVSEIRERIIETYTPHDLRDKESPHLRQEAAQEAQAIIDKMKCYIS